MVSYYNSLGSMFPASAASAPGSQLSRSQHPNPPGSAYFNPYSAANYHGSSLASQNHSSSGGIHPQAFAPVNPQYNPHHHQLHHPHHQSHIPPPPHPSDLNSNMYSGSVQFPGFDGPPVSPSAHWQSAPWSSTFPPSGNHVQPRYDWSDSSKGDDYSPLNQPGAPSSNGGGGEDSSDNPNSSSDAPPLASSPPSFNQSSSESPNGTPTSNSNNNHSYINPGPISGGSNNPSAYHHPHAHLLQSAFVHGGSGNSMGGGGTQTPPEVSPLTGDESANEGNYSREDESGGGVSLPASSLSPPPLVPRPQPARSPFQWMKKPAYSNSPTEKSGRTRTKDKYRVVYSDHQRLELEKEFHYSRYITIRRKAELANNVGLSERQVKIWFQNRRAKERRALKKTDDPKDMKDGMSPDIVSGSLAFSDAMAPSGLLVNNIPHFPPSHLPPSHFPPGPMKYE
ncbi:uncharacterized protein [Lepeophtheirus salmonis]|uniref:Caudallike [Bombyx mori] n=1 Tax=Lepeophtheirus salmonis TaxID=72036 RepID=A0A0K2UIB1_LEPSM|nr:homeotic protein caudal-like [Lepeophtheirus salmonis]XP_040564016.1 homeotic protein caudal-like [Lepeophtheirus salmonis]